MLDHRLSQVDFNNRQAYAEMLSRMSAPLSAFEIGLSAGIAPVLFTSWASRLRGHALRKDLIALEAPFRARAVAPIEDEAEALGALYVLEGSRLGGQVLARMASASADPVVRNATRYFRHGERQGLWRTFLDRLESSRAVRDNPERAKRGAVNAFEAFEAAFA